MTLLTVSNVPFLYFTFYTLLSCNIVHTVGIVVAVFRNEEARTFSMLFEPSALFM